MKFIPNPRFVALFQHTLAARQIRQEAAEKIADRAQQIAPVDQGEYRDGISADGGRVNAHSFKSHWIEFGTIDTPTFAPLRRAAVDLFGANSLRRR